MQDVNFKVEEKNSNIIWQMFLLFYQTRYLSIQQGSIKINLKRYMNQ